MHVSSLHATSPPEAFQTLYTQFADRAIRDFCWPSATLPYENVLQQVKAELMHVLLLYEGDDLRGFWLYVFPGHHALELCAFYTDPATPIDETETRAAFQLALEHWETLPGWEAFSFGCYGVQNATAQALVQDTRFAAAEQHILQRPIVDRDAAHLKKDRKKPPFPYAIHPMKPKWVKALAGTLAASFCDEPDALWDPRFRDAPGATRLLEQILGGGFGHYHEAFSFVVVDELRKPVPVGAIFALQVEERVLNIPLLFVHPQHRGKGLATSLMHQLLKSILPHAEKLPGLPLMINATTNPVQRSARSIYDAYGFTLHEAGHHVYMSTPKT